MDRHVLQDLQEYRNLRSNGIYKNKDLAVLIALWLIIWLALIAIQLFSPSCPGFLTVLQEACSLVNSGCEVSPTHCELFESNFFNCTYHLFATEAYNHLFT
jgi:hypothetical protein